MKSFSLSQNCCFCHCFFLCFKFKFDLLGEALINQSDRGSDTKAQLRRAVQQLKLLPKVDRTNLFFMITP